MVNLGYHAESGALKASPSVAASESALASFISQIRSQTSRVSFVIQSLKNEAYYIDGTSEDDGPAAKAVGIASSIPHALADLNDEIAALELVVQRVRGLF